MRIENLIALGIDSATEDIPKVEHGFGNNLHTVTGVTTDEHASIVVEDFVLKGRKNIVNDVPVVIGVGHTAERSVRVQLGKSTLDEDTLAVRVNVGILIVRVVLGVLRGVGTHNEMLS